VIIIGKIEFNLDNLRKCICTTCPVPVESECIKQNLIKMQEILGELEGDEISPSESIPALYCAGGKSSCEDLDYDKLCQCAECSIWKEENLEDGVPMGYFCRDGEAR
jgi:hypothetical protein